MQAELFLIVPPQADPQRLSAVLAANEISAVLLRRGDLPENAYKAQAKLLVPLVQAAGAAVLVEGEPGLVRLLGADGLHVEGDASAVKDAIATLKPSLIVGAGAVDSRDDAMRKGELGVDYILFGPISGDIAQAEREMAHWWAQTMEIPSVLSDPAATAASYDAEGCEFIGLHLAMAEPAA